MVLHSYRGPPVLGSPRKSLIKTPADSGRDANDNEVPDDIKVRQTSRRSYVAGHICLCIYLYINPNVKINANTNIKMNMNVNGTINMNICTYIYIYDIEERDRHMQSLPLFNKAPPILKPPSPNPAFSQYIFKRGQYRSQLKLLTQTDLPKFIRIGTTL